MDRRGFIGGTMACVAALNAIADPNGAGLTKRKLENVIVMNRHEFNRRAALCAAAVGLLSAIVAGCATNPLDDPASRAYTPDIFKKGETILFIGDSLTDGNHGPDMNHYLGHTFASDIAKRYLAYRPELALHFANRGKGGENSSEVRRRWTRDAVPYTPSERGYGVPYPGCEGVPRLPDWISILVGYNDSWKVKELPPAKLEENLRYMITTARKANPNVKIVLCDLFFKPSRKLNAEARERQEIVRRLAKEYDLYFVPFERLFHDTLVKEREENWWVWDSCHPTCGAHLRMADFWLQSVAEQVRDGRRSANCGH